VVKRCILLPWNGLCSSIGFCQISIVFSSLLNFCQLTQLFVRDDKPTCDAHRYYFLLLIRGQIKSGGCVGTFETIFETIMLGMIKNVCQGLRSFDADYSKMFSNKDVKFPMHPSTHGGGPFVAWNSGAHLI